MFLPLSYVCTEDCVGWFFTRQYSSGTILRRSEGSDLVEIYLQGPLKLSAVNTHAVHQPCMCVASFLYNYVLYSKSARTERPSPPHFLLSLFLDFCPPYISYPKSPFTSPLFHLCCLHSLPLLSPHPDMSCPHGNLSTAGLYWHHRQCSGHEVH